LETVDWQQSGDNWTWNYREVYAVSPANNVPLIFDYSWIDRHTGKSGSSSGCDFSLDNFFDIASGIVAILGIDYKDAVALVTCAKELIQSGIGIFDASMSEDDRYSQLGEQILACVGGLSKEILLSKPAAGWAIGKAIADACHLDL
jgi:hypothetical protein